MPGGLGVPKLSLKELECPNYFLSREEPIFMFPLLFEAILKLFALEELEF
jgi:hypothetical protein